jgi:hypothetical protein
MQKWKSQSTETTNIVQKREKRHDKFVTISSEGKTIKSIITHKQKHNHKSNVTGNDLDLASFPLLT